MDKKSKNSSLKEFYKEKFVIKVYSYYCLDIIHKGHLLMMKKSKDVAGKKWKVNSRNSN